MVCPSCNNKHTDDLLFHSKCKQCYPYIDIDDCKDNYLYEIDARNSTLGIYSKENYWFTISRFKFTSNFIYQEYHWDVGLYVPDNSQFGTVKPLKELELIDTSIINDEVALLKFLNDYKK